VNSPGNDPRSRLASFLSTLHRIPRISVVIDALATYRGAERVLAAVLELYPRAPIHTLVYEPSAFTGTRIAQHRVQTSFIQKIPGGRTHYRGLLPLLPLAIERLDLRNYDIILSFNYAVAHGVVCRPDQLHIAYTFAPLRYAWQDSGEFFQRGLAAPAARLILHYFRVWDRAAADGVDHFAAISHWTAACIRKAYGREAEVVYPPVEIESFVPLSPRGDYFVAVARLVRHKRLELLLEAFSRLGLPLLLIGEGPERHTLEALAGPNVRLLGATTNQEKAALLGKARALVHAAAEDFGLVLAEAQAAGCPVIAYRRGAASEIVQDGKTGVLFSEPSVESLVAGVQRFMRREDSFAPRDCVANVQRFSKLRFQTAFSAMVERQWSAFPSGGRRAAR
jgi:glycosyltransferase involved in cell wall biosynthesis